MPPVKAPSHAIAHEHLSPAPIVVALGSFLMYLGFVYRGVLLALGTLVFLGGIFIWVREDTQMFARRHVDHGVSPGRDLGWWAMILFLCTEVMLFAGLFAAFFMIRHEHHLAWHLARVHLDAALPLVTINTIILVISGVFAHMAYSAIKKGNRSRFISLLIVAMVLGITFLGLQIKEYMDLISHGVTITASQFGSTFYLLTGTHALHVFMGVVFFGIILARAFMGQFDKERHVGVEAFVIYWHFVDVVWIALYLIVYVGVI